VPYGHGLDAWLAEFGPDVVVVAPEELRAGVLERLRAVAAGPADGADRADRAAGLIGEEEPAV
jgi:hypothetical protein